MEPGLYNCPVVSKNYLDYPDGNFEFADNLEPVAINLVPYIGKAFPVAQSQQVIVTDVSVFKPNISCRALQPVRQQYAPLFSSDTNSDEILYLVVLIFLIYDQRLISWGYICIHVPGLLGSSHSTT